MMRSVAAAAMLITSLGLAGCRGETARGPSLQGLTDAASACPGLGRAGVAVRAFLPDAAGLAAGAGAEISSVGALGLLGRWDLGAWTLRETGSDRWSGMAEASLGFGSLPVPVSVLGGVGFALPLWDSGSLDLDPTLVLYAEVWAPLGDDGEGGSVGSLAVRRTWYTREATLGGLPVDLDGWSLLVTLHF